MISGMVRKKTASRAPMKSVAKSVTPSTKQLGLDFEGRHRRNANREEPSENATRQKSPDRHQHSGKAGRLSEGQVRLFSRPRRAAHSAGRGHPERGRKKRQKQAIRYLVLVPAKADLISSIRPRHRFPCASSRSTRSRSISHSFATWILRRRRPRSYMPSWI